ncbi:MAG: AAA family ATPase [Neisseria zoodegmatis]|uniref:AAA family ATPase n=1 Tax=Neisseria zoodegmatis TaxID=326523 RepID=UPI0026ECAF29|nr:AAA family ATPase [Neisseria zoodegmatis]MDO5069851.1 AAA family ATPase [Neisseria zoodegmatis]
MRNRLLTLLNKLNQGLVGREETVRTALLTLLAGENLLLVGPPGTGKSLLARRISQALAEPSDGQRYFEYLLTKFSTPEELFGPLSISALKQDRFHRQTKGYLPTVQVAFLDEIFKASSSILNALLTVLNERKYHNGTDTEAIPLQAMVAASNELPQGQAELAALYDRFLVRRFIGYLTSEERKQLFQLPPAADIKAEHRLSIDELFWLRQAAANVMFPNEVQQAILEIWQAHQQAFKDDADESLSNRRMVKILHLLRVAATSNGRIEVDFSDLMLLKDCLWNNEANAEKVVELIRNVLRRFDRLVSSENEAEATPAIAATTPASPIGSRFKGLRGSGTENDPILIENIQQLGRLADPVIGKQGLYFRQTADIDGTPLGETWLDIDEFQGHYDGGGFTIKAETDKPLFRQIKESTICNLMIDGINLTDTAENSRIINCRTSHNLAAHIKHSMVSNCETMGSLAENIYHSEISSCQAGSVLIVEKADESQIKDCLVLLNYQGHYEEYRGGVVGQLINSQIERCFVRGMLIYRGNGYFHFYGIAYLINTNSSIHHCALGQLERSYTDVKIESRIARVIDTSSSLQHNISIDSNNDQTLGSSYTSDRNGQDGLSVPAALFNAEYLEYQLGWDFDTVWQWPQDSDHPTLRPYTGSPFTTQASSHTEGQTSLLALQCRQNIWLGNQGA